MMAVTAVVAAAKVVRAIGEGRGKRRNCERKDAESAERGGLEAIHLSDPPQCIDANRANATIRRNTPKCYGTVAFQAHAELAPARTQACF